ncbi:MAG TPA: cell surface protein SprA, partial [Cytophagaceae bacterium]|nr:cell surface protein SprA [Cytophagaceae bacterium]
NYDDYRHFFIGHFFRDNFEGSLRNLPIVTSGVTVTQVDVYITNSNNTTQNVRNVVAFLDLGEAEKYCYNPKNYTFGSAVTNDNTTNNLYNLYHPLASDPLVISQSLANDGFVKGTDFELINNARKLKPEEYTFNPNLGYISLVTPLRSYEVLAVAYQYAYQGTAHVVGDVSGLVQTTSTSDTSSALVLKLLKPSSIQTHLPSWPLMMKNIYQLGSTQINKDNFLLRVIYKDDISGADLPNLQEGQNTRNVPIVRILEADQLNQNGDPYPDGNFDFVDGVTVDSKNGRVIFPVLEPLGSDLQKKFNPTTEANLINKYVYYELYDSTKSDAMQIAAVDKYFLTGRLQSSASNEIVLPGAINLAPGSVKVIAGSNTLVEGTDYTVDYNQGKVKILNEGVLNSGQQINISYEQQDLFNVRQKSFMGTRLDYRVNKDITIGGTLLHQNERPTLTRVNIGNEPSSNTLWGLDGTAKGESKLLTKIIDKLPFYQTKVPSFVTAKGEVANLIPGHNKALNKSGQNGAAYLDDFEAAETPYDFSKTPTKWKLASVPVGLPEYSKTDISYGYHRALLAWYNIDNILYPGSGSQRPSGLPDTIYNIFERQVSPQEIFPQLNRSQVQLNQTTMDMAYYPNRRGPYNYDPMDVYIDPVKNTENLTDPINSWAGISRMITNDVDFDNANIQYIEFWMLNPYFSNDVSKHRTDIDGVPFNKNNSGKLYFNLGSISEDVLKDQRLEYENGLPVAGETTTTNTIWGIVSNQQPLVNAFGSATNARDIQDVGLDGLNNSQEAAFVNTLNPSLSSRPDPAGDDFIYYLDGTSPSILDRYQYYNGIDKNSPVNSANSNYTNPDNEDINQDNTLETIDAYYEYEVDINSNSMKQGANFIVGHAESVVNSGTDTVQYLQFRVPIRSPTTTVGGISDYKTIRFIRMYMTGFSSPIVLRFAQLQLVASQWRIYQPDDINQTGFGYVNEPDPAQLIVSTVSIEENSQSGSSNSSPYVLPPGMIRDQDPVSTTQRSLNEQSLRLTVNNLLNMDARAAYKNVTFNLLNYGRLDMFLHAETPDPNTKDGDMNAFLRIGTDFTQNYYEIEVPLYFSAPNNSDANVVWPSQNTINVGIQDMINVKLARDRLTSNRTTPYSEVMGNVNINVMGNPDLSTVIIAMIGIRNPAKNSITGSSSDVTAKSATIWADEMRVVDFTNQSGWATTASVNTKLADLANVTTSMKYTTVGFGGLDQSISQRQLSNNLNYGVSATVTLDKFIPEKVGLKLPMYVSLDRILVAPEYNPLDPDVKMSNYSRKELDTLRKQVEDITTMRSINFTNVKKIKTKKGAKNHFYDISNLAFTFGYNEVKRKNFTMADYSSKLYKASINYNHTFKPLHIEPFKNFKLVRSKYLRLIKDINLNPVPTSFLFRNDVNRSLVETEYYEAGPYTPVQTPLFQKSFMLTRTYALPWNITKSINLNYTATANAIVDEPARAPGDQAYKDTLWRNFVSLGRMKNFNQGLNATYKLPLDKFPMLNWLNSDVNYTTGVIWTAGPINLKDSLGNPLNLGNIINNKNNINVTGKINLETLYNKVKFFKLINTPPEPPKGPPNKLNANGKDTTKRFRKPELQVLKSTIRMIMLVRSINFTYGTIQSTQLAGYLPTPTYIGVDGKGPYDQSSDLGAVLPFMFGSQNSNFRNIAAEKGWITKTTELNTPYLQTKNNTLDVKALVEPIRDFKIQLESKKTNGSNYQEIFRADSAGKYNSYSPSRNGTYSITYISILTAFTNTHGANNFNRTFQTFSNNRQQVLERMGSPAGYIPNSQDVLVPAFLAAYSGRDVHKQKLTNFPKIPLPNWNLTYSGLTKLKFIQERFSSVTLTHGYSSTYSVGNYQSSLIYGDGFIRPEFNVANAVKGDSLNSSGVIVPVYSFSEVSIREQFSPLIGLNVKTKSKVTYKIQYNRGRNLALSMTNAQMREDDNQDIVLGVSYIKSGVRLPKFQGRSTVLKNELNFQLNMTIRNTKSYQRILDQGSTITAGNFNFQIKPTISYMVSHRVTMLLYVEHTRAIPALSSSFKRNTTAFGLQIRFTLS